MVQRGASGASHRCQSDAAIRCRVVWTRLTRDALCWEQAYSADGGKTWETSWIMSFTRLAAAP
jgi:hypothetical protein